MKLFDILGPVMIGPSSSHTAGAAKIGRTARKLLGEMPVQAEIQLHGSFAKTGEGHGTDKAIVAGLLGYYPDDPRLPDSFSLARQAGMHFSFRRVELRGAHPNTALLNLTGKNDLHIEVMAASLGGGRIEITRIDGVEARFSGDYNTLVIHNMDTPGHVAAVTKIISNNHTNIAGMQVFRRTPGEWAVMVIECDQTIPGFLVEELQAMPGIRKVSCLNLQE